MIDASLKRFAARIKDRIDQIWARVLDLPAGTPASLHLSSLVRCQLLVKFILSSSDLDLDESLVELGFQEIKHDVDSLLILEKANGTAFEVYDSATLRNRVALDRFRLIKNIPHLTQGGPPQLPANPQQSERILCLRGATTASFYAKNPEDKNTQEQLAAWVHELSIAGDEYSVS